MQFITVNGSTSFRDVLAQNVINSHSALTIAPYWRAQNFKAGNLASFGRSVYRDGAKLDVPHALDRILKRKPNQFQTGTQFWQAWFFDASHHGNGYAKIRRTGTMVAGLYNLLPADVQPFIFVPEDSDPELDAEKWFIHKPTKSLIANDDMLHLAGISPDGHNGYDPTELLRDTLDRAKCIDQYTTKMLRKGTVIRGWIKAMPGATDEEKAQIKSTIAAYRGPEAENDVPVLSGAELMNASLSPEKTQLIEQSANATKQIAQLTGVPPEFLFESSEAKYNTNVEAMGHFVVTYLFRPWIEAAEDELTIKLLSESEQAEGYTIKINPDALLRGDTKQQSDIVLAQVGKPIRTPNEGRALLGLPPSDDPSADKLATPAGAPAPSPESPAAEAPAEKSADAFAAIRPWLLDAIERVETKASKGLATVAKKSDSERVIAGNVFAEQQAGYVAQELQRVAEAMEKQGSKLDVEKIAERYSAEIRRRAAGHEPKPLAQIVGETIDGQ